MLLKRIFGPRAKKNLSRTASFEDIDSNISYLGFCYCRLRRVLRSLIDFFYSIDP